MEKETLRKPRIQKRRETENLKGKQNFEKIQNSERKRNIENVKGKET